MKAILHPETRRVFLEGGSELGSTAFNGPQHVIHESGRGVTYRKELNGWGHGIRERRGVAAGKSRLDGARDCGGSRVRGGLKGGLPQLFRKTIQGVECGVAHLLRRVSAEFNEALDVLWQSARREDE